MDFPQLLGLFYTTFAAKADTQSAINLYLERIESGMGRGEFAMIRSPGLKTFSHNFNPAKLVCRGLFELNGHVFNTQSDTIYDLIGDGTAAFTYGPIDDDGLIVSQDASQNSFFVVSKQKLYRINGGALTAPVTPFTPLAVGVLEGLIVCIGYDPLISTNPNRVYFSVDDGATWNALDYQTVESYPNSLISLVVDHEELWLFGNRRTVVFVLGSDPRAPLDPVSAGIIEMGLAAPRAVGKLDNSIYWLGRNKDGDHQVFRANGYTPQRVSNHAIENIFRSYPNHEDATMATYQLNGHSCLRLTFPSARNGLGATWEYDVSTGNWGEIAFWNPQMNRYERHRGNCIVSAFQSIWVGDYANGVMYHMSPDYNTDFGYPIRWERKTPHVTKNGKNVQYQRLDLFMNNGEAPTDPVWINDHSMTPAAFAAALASLVGATTITAAQSNAMQAIYDWKAYDQDLALPGPAVMTPLGFFDFATNPYVEMSFSDNGGKSFGRVRQRSIGRAGDFKKRIYFNFLGRGRDRVWYLSGNAAAKQTIVQATFEAVECLT